MWFRRLHRHTSDAFPDATWAPADDTKEAGTALGRDIASHLRHEVPLLLSLLDRNALMAQFADYNPRSSLPYRTAMLAAEGSSTELDGLLAQFELLDGWSAPFVAWARNYAAGHRVA